MDPERSRGSDIAAHENPPIRSSAERRARRSWHRFTSAALDRLRDEGFVAKPMGRSRLIESRRALPDKLIVLRSDGEGETRAQAARPSRDGRTEEYLALAVEVQIRIDRALRRLARRGELEPFVVEVTAAAAELGAEDQKSVEAERVARGGRFPEKRERSASVRAASAGLPSLGKRH